MIKHSLSLAMLLTLVSCLDSSNSNNSKKSLREGLSAEQLEGKYTSHCINDGDKSFVDSFEFQQSLAQVTVTNFNGPDCPSGAEVEQFRTTYSFTFNGALLEFIKGKYFYTFYDSDQTSNYNATPGFCEITNWIANEEQEITGKNCDGEAFVTGEKFLVSAKKEADGIVINSNKYYLE